MANPHIKDILDYILLPEGFIRNSKGVPIYKRETQGALQEIGLRRGFSGGDDYAIYFNVPEDDTEYELSPVCPLKNTYWWPEKLDPKLSMILRDQIENVVLGYFRNKESINLTKVEDVFGVLIGDPYGFEAFDDGYWRIQEDYIHIIDVELLAAGTFAYIYATVWHKTLIENGELFEPDYVTRSASKVVGVNGIQSKESGSLFSLFNSKNKLNVEIITTILDYFSCVNTVIKVKENIRREYRSKFENT